MFSWLKVLFFALALQSFSAFATHEVYQLDRASFASDEDYNYCKDLVKETFEVKEKDPGQVIFVLLEDAGKNSTKVQLIQDEQKSTQGEGAYEGDYNDRIYLVKYDGMGVYKFGLYSSVQILTFQKGIIVEKKPLNYLSSEEMLNQASCQKIYYKRIKS